MSQENMEIVRAVNEAWIAGDVQRTWDSYDPDVVMRTVEEWPEAGPYFGREAVIRFFEQLRDTWEAVELETISLIDAGDRVVGQYRWHSTGPGPDMNLEITQVVTLRQGKMVMVEYFRHHSDALEAVGLSEQDANADC
jgi:ketosteroid isomerase-like protein